MKNILARIGSLLLVFSLFGFTQPASADSGVIGTPPEPPDPAAPSLLFSGCDCLIVGSSNASFEQQVINLVNQERARWGRNPLVRSEGLTNAARYHAADLSQDNYFKHDTYDMKDGKLTDKAVCGVWDRIAKYYTGANGENIAAGFTTPQSVMDAWMNSEGHRNNILNPSTVSIGVGYYKGSGDYTHYWVQDFGVTVDKTSSPTSDFLPQSLSFMYSIPDQKLYPSHQEFTVSSSDSSSWQVSQSGTFFSATQGAGANPAQIRITPENFNSYQAGTYTGSVTVGVTDPEPLVDSQQTIQINLTVVNSAIHQIYLPGIIRLGNSQQKACTQN